MEPLELRRLRFDLVQYFKIFNNLSSITPVDYFNIRQPSLTSRAPVPFLVKPINKPNYVLSFFYRSLNCWNSLPLEVKQSNSLNTFKFKLKSVDLTQFLKGDAFNLSWSVYCVHYFEGVSLVIPVCILRRPVVCMLLYFIFVISMPCVFMQSINKSINQIDIAY